MNCEWVVCQQWKNSTLCTTDIQHCAGIWAPILLRCEVLRAALLKIPLFWDMTPCGWASICILRQTKEEYPWRWRYQSPSKRSYAHINMYPVIQEDYKLQSLTCRRLSPEIFQSVLEQWNDMIPKDFDFRITRINTKDFTHYWTFVQKIYSWSYVCPSKFLISGVTTEILADIFTYSLGCLNFGSFLYFTWNPD